MLQHKTILLKNNLFQNYVINFDSILKKLLGQTYIPAQRNKNKPPLPNNVDAHEAIKNSKKMLRDGFTP